MRDYAAYCCKLNATFVRLRLVPHYSLCKLACLFCWVIEREEGARGCVLMRTVVTIINNGREDIVTPYPFPPAHCLFTSDILLCLAPPPLPSFINFTPSSSLLVFLPSSTTLHLPFPFACFLHQLCPANGAAVWHTPLSSSGHQHESLAGPWGTALLLESRLPVLVISA